MKCYSSEGSTSAAALTVLPLNDNRIESGVSTACAAGAPTHVYEVLGFVVRNLRAKNLIGPVQKVVQGNNIPFTQHFLCVFVVAVQSKAGRERIPSADTREITMRVENSVEAAVPQL